MADQVYKYSLEVKVREADQEGRAKLSSIFNYFQDGAQVHARQIGVGHKILLERNIAWFLTAMKIEIVRLPLWEEEFVLETWPKGERGLFFLRDFYIKDTEGNILIAGTSEWLIIDCITQKPLRPKSISDEITVRLDEDAVTPVKRKTAFSETAEFCRDVKVEYSNLDINRHTNNAIYVDWATDCLQEQGIPIDTLSSFQIHFITQTRLGETISLYFDKENKALFGRTGETNIFLVSYDS